MVKGVTVQEIIDMKLRGYSLNEIEEHYKRTSGKTPSRPTLRKYYGMDVVPADMGERLVKEKVFDTEPWKSAIKLIVEQNRDCYSSSVYDVLIERFVENGTYEELPGSERTLRTFIKYMINSGQVDIKAREGRIFEHVFDTPPGHQMLMDFGEERIKAGLTVHFLCLLLRYSRMMCVIAQDHKFNAEEACRAIYHGFCKLEGRPTELVLDQDSVFIKSEYLGEVIETGTFRDFITEQELRLWVCNKQDPQSKGPIENVVGFVKKNFFSARHITCIDDVWRSLPGWVERKNKRIHQATYYVPQEIFNEYEKSCLKGLIPSVYETAVSSYIAVDVGDSPYILYKSSKYSVPRKFCFKRAYYKVVGAKLHIYDSDLRHECTHDINPCKGGVSKLQEHAKLMNTDWLPVCERLRERWNCYDFQHFINGFKKENPRHLFKQLSAVEEFLAVENPPNEITAAVMGECCREFRYRFSQFKTVYYRMKAGFVRAGAPMMDSVQNIGLEVYQKAFMERCE